MKAETHNKNPRNSYCCCGSECKLSNKFVICSTTTVLAISAIAFYNRSKILPALKSISDYTMSCDFSLIGQVIAISLVMFFLTSLLDYFMNKTLCNPASRIQPQK